MIVWKPQPNTRYVGRDLPTCIGAQWHGMLDYVRRLRAWRDMETRWPHLHDFESEERVGWFRALDIHLECRTDDPQFNPKAVVVFTQAGQVVLEYAPLGHYLCELRAHVPKEEASRLLGMLMQVDQAHWRRIDDGWDHAMEDWCALGRAEDVANYQATWANRGDGEPTAPAKEPTLSVP